MVGPSGLHAKLFGMQMPNICSTRSKSEMLSASATKPAIAGERDRADELGRRPNVHKAARMIEAAGRRQPDIDPLERALLLAPDRALAEDVGLLTDADDH